MKPKDRYIRKAMKLERKAKDLENNYSYLRNPEAQSLKNRAKWLRGAAEKCE